MLIALGVMVTFLLLTEWENRRKVTYSQFLTELDANNIAAVEIVGRTQIRGEFYRPPSPEGTAGAKTQPPSSTETSSPPARPDSPEPATSEATDEATGKSSPGTAEGTRPATGDQADQKRFVCQLPLQVGEGLLEKLHAKGVTIRAEQPAEYGDLFVLASFFLIGMLLIGAWTMMRRTRDQMMGGGMLSGVTKSPARRYDIDANRITFNDVAGLEGVKSDLQEIVHFLQDHEEFERLGAQIPKGVLLMGPPGTGKTLLARAVAGEAGVPFFSINGSEFIQLFVGVGAGRVRDMFKTAKQQAPSILFIDEIDAVGRQRGAGLGGGHDEREQTLNQILSEMDGFTPSLAVIVIAATNRPDVLDPALLRPGRFDRHITVDRPSLAGRRELFELHAKNVPIAEDVDFEKLARATVGLTGADIRNLVNEAALWATRSKQETVRMRDFEHARDKVLMGGKREDILSEEEKEITAYHEAGHALLAWLVPGSDRVHKVTIVPRGRALGVTQLVPEEDRHNIGRRDLDARLAMMLGGRTAEKMQFGEYSAGAESDLKEATRLARRMVTRWGMSERLGPVAYSNSEEHPFLGREIVQEDRQFSEKTAEVIDDEVARILHEAADHSLKLLTQERDKLQAIAEALLQHEELDEDQLRALIGPSVHHQRPPIDAPPNRVEANGS
jgi:cell division protease FtsH